MPKVVDHEQRRAELVDAAIDAIADVGLERVTLREIAQRVGATTGTIGHYFRDKDELLVATLHHLAELLAQPDSTAVNFTHARLGLHLPIDEASRRHWRVWLAYCGAAPSSPTLLAAYHEFYARIEQSVADHLERNGVDDATEIAGAIVAAVDGIGLCASVAPELWPVERQQRTLHRLLDNLIARTPTGASL
ncbi:MAG: TetR family transcriptional regulator C-terminal domain-containing protein [Actinomycetota bacterium]